MSEDQDKRLREALRSLQPPPPTAEARERIRAAVAAAAAEPAAGLATATTEPPRSRRRRAFAVFARHRRLALGLAASAVAVLVAAVAVVGSPSVGGPEPVSASEVLQKAMRARSSGRTLAAEVTLTIRTNALWATQAQYEVDHYDMLMRADGSFRLSRRGPPPVGWSMGGSRPSAEVVFDALRGVVSPYPSAEVAFDARRGVLSTYSPDRGVIVRAGYSLGPPDRWPDPITRADFSAVARALDAVRATRVRTAVFEGRPAWIITCSLASIPSRPRVSVYWSIYEITIDHATALPVCFREFRDGQMRAEVRYRNLRANVPLPDDAFELKAPEGASASRIRGGFRLASVAAIATLPGYTALVPKTVPPGFRLDQAAVAKHGLTANRRHEGRNIVALKYGRGFDSLTVTTRSVADAYHAAFYDPFELDQQWAREVAWTVRIRAGAFAGKTARVVVAPGTTVPHLWAVKDGVLLTIAGSATADDLVAIATSLEPARP